MKLRNALLAITTAVAALAVLPGCAVTRDQETVGAYIDDATVTTSIKARFVTDKTVDATSIKVETLKGEVLLSGFARSVDERQTAEAIARDTKGVRWVTNQIVVRS